MRNKRLFEVTIKGILSFANFVAFSLAPPAGALEERYPAGHPDQGLPHPDFVLAPFHEDSNHILNRIFRASVLVTAVPAEVGQALPREHRDPTEFFRKPLGFLDRFRRAAGGEFK
jgi:hypothetical protein